eukprot:jgi/Orpsp1_1/1188307/evm.model.d7180000063788.1
MKISSFFLSLALILIFNVSISLAQEAGIGNEHLHKSGFDIQKIILRYIPKNPMVAALSSVVYITMIPLILLKFLPSNLPKSLLNALLAFALGTVLGDVFLHMIPSLMSPKPEEVENEKLQHDIDHDHQISEHLVDIGMLMLSGIIIFYVLEKIVDLFGEEHGNDRDDKPDHNNKHSHRHHSDLENKQEYADKVFSSKNDDQYFGEDEMNNKKNKNNGLKKRKPLKKRERENSTTYITNKAIEKEHKAKVDSINNVSSSSYVKAIMQVMASMTHGFTDGLSVTFAFISSPSSGLTTAFAMFLHEIPHKFGDYTIMRQLGFSSRKAISMQFISALGTMLGSVAACIIFWMSSTTSSISINDLCDSYIMPITTGSLIYLALVGMLPELINYKPRGVLRSLVQIILEVLFFGLGAYIMKWIALNE